MLLNYTPRKDYMLRGLIVIIRHINKVIIPSGKRKIVEVMANYRERDRSYSEKDY